MSKKVRFLQSSKDLAQFADFLSRQNARLYTYHAQELPLAEPESMSDGCLRILPRDIDLIIMAAGKYDIFSEAYSYIEFIRLKAQDGCVRESTVVLHRGALNNSRHDAVEKLFTDIKNFMRKQYILSDDKTCYIARDFMNCWLARTVSTDFIIRRKELKINRQKTDRDALTEFIKSQRYAISAIRHNERSCDTDADVLAVSASENDVILRLNNRALSISLDSNCVFIFRDKEYDRIMLDKRLCNENKSAVGIFERLEEYARDQGDTEQ